MAQTINARYWEHKAEKAHETPGNSRTTSSDEPSGSKSVEKFTTPKPTSKPTSTPSSSALSSTPSKPWPAYADKLGKDGKLMLEEQTRWIKNSLRLFCGGAGHKALECKKSGSSAAKAHAVLSTPVTIPTTEGSEK